MDILYGMKLYGIYDTNTLIMIVFKDMRGYSSNVMNNTDYIYEDERKQTKGQNKQMELY